MRSCLVLVLFLLNLQFITAQTPILLRDTMITGGATMIFTYKKSKSLKFLDKSRHKNVQGYAISAKSLIPDTLALAREKYDSLYLYTFNSEATSFSQLCIYDAKTQKHTCYEPLDTFDLIFYTGDFSENIKIRVALKDLNNENITFDLLHHQYAYLPEFGKYITLWPYMMGVSISLQDSVDAHLLFENNYALNEIIPINDTIQMVFDFYDYKKRKIAYSKMPLQERIIGNKKGRYIDPQLYEVNKLTILYFGGHWCGHCLDEVPKLKKLYGLQKKHDFDLTAILTYTEGSEEEAENYYMEYLFPITSQVLGLEHSLIHKLRVVSYPSYIVVDQDGKIIYRSDTDEDDPHVSIYRFIKDL